MIDVALLGTGGMMPLPNRFLTSLLCRLNGRLFMIDCGEGTQVTMKLLGWGFKNIDCICFTHFHADHISGLPGLLLTIGNAGRTEPLTLVGPEGLKRVVESLCVIAPELPFPVYVMELPPRSREEWTVGEFHIRTLPVDHRIACFAYSLQVKRRGKFDVEKANALQVPKAVWSRLQREPEVAYEGKSYTCDMVLGPPRRGIKVCYCTDTRPVKALPGFVEGADLFICEGIYGEDDKIDKAREYKHMVFSEAAQIAREGKVNELWLTHYSPALTDPAAFLHMAKDIFPHTVAGYDRINKTILFTDN